MDHPNRIVYHHAYGQAVSVAGQDNKGLKLDRVTTIGFLCLCEVVVGRGRILQCTCREDSLRSFKFSGIQAMEIGTSSTPDAVLS